MMEFFYNVLGNWQIIGLSVLAVLLVYRNFFRSYYEEMWSWFPWRKRWVLFAASIILIIQFREICGFPFDWMSSYFPTYSFAARFFFYMGNIHVRSILFWALMIFYLWKKMGNLLPAVLVGWFWIGLAELTFIPQHLIWCDGLFLGFQHYLPFILIMCPVLLEHKRFSLPWKAWIWFLVGVFFQYFGLIFYPWAVVKLAPGGWGFIANTSIIPDPHLFTYVFDVCQHLIKTFFTIAGAHTVLCYRKKFHRAFKAEKQKDWHRNQECD